eukprot:NODE_22562_length_703_cov_3.680556.p4 GENE.NODE_22562_length_703_cov_3.680556~~NODE_22562_length_703_cov_3.680556.p4  ORF type:complete len:63 (+),score=5.03 NODE_22562_length_703_cov_3.680556:160-348(+)
MLSAESAKISPVSTTNSPVPSPLAETSRGDEVKDAIFGVMQQRLVSASWPRPVEAMELRYSM